MSFDSHQNIFKEGMPVKKRMKKVVLMFLTLLLLLVPITAYADTTCIVTGTKNYLALRNAPRTDERNEIGKLRNGDYFIVTSGGQNGFAYGHTVGGYYGYVNANYLRAADYYQPQYTPTPQYNPAPQYTTAPQYNYSGGTPKMVTGTKNYLALRSSPVRSESNEIGRLYNGDTFYVTEWGNTGFAYGHTASGRYGYVVSAYLR